eukprot:gene8570-34004_t
MAVLSLLLCTMLVAVSHAEPDLGNDLPDRIPGPAIAGVLGSNGMDVIARSYGMTAANLHAIINQDKDDIWLTKEGKLAYSCTGLHDHDHLNHRHLREVKSSDRLSSTAKRQLTFQPATDTADAFRLHSKPTASLVVYLDFHGGLAEKGYLVEEPTVISGYDIDGDSGSFSTEELQNIIDIWSMVSDHFAPWEMDITTEDPGLEAITRSSTDDKNYGQRVVFGVDPACNITCPVPTRSGVGEVGSFGSLLDTPIYMFMNKGDRRDVANYASHELGHSLGLFHHGNSSYEWFLGHGEGYNSWAPIMGGGFSDHGSDTDSATLLTSDVECGSVVVSPQGIISTPGQSDYFRIDHAGGTIVAFAGGSYTSAYGDNEFTLPVLNCQIQLRDVDGNVLDSAPVQSPLEGSLLARKNYPAGTYYMTVTGVGFGDGFDTGYTNYGSLGQYWLDVRFTKSDLFSLTMRITSQAGRTDINASLVNASYAVIRSEAVRTAPINTYSDPMYVYPSSGPTNNQDCLLISPLPISSSPESMLYMVCDGHSGAEAAKFVTSNFLRLLEPKLPSKMPNNSNLNDLEVFAESLRKVLCETFVRLDQEWGRYGNMAGKLALIK